MNNPNNNAVRNYSVDVFRIILMIMIVAHHGVVHGMKLSSISQGIVSNEIFSGDLFLLNGFLVVAVNCFFWISGYFGIRYKTNRLVSLYFDGSFYLFIVGAAISLLNGFSIINILKAGKTAILPIKVYWFIAAYIAVYLVADFINKLLDSLSVRQQKILLVAVFAINTIYGMVFDIGQIGNGYTVVQGVYMYIVGAICKNLFKVNKRKKTCLLIYVICSLIVGGISYVLYRINHPTFSWNFFAYNNPIIVIATVSLCIFVVSGDNKYNKFIGFICDLSKGALAVYLLTDFYAARDFVFEPLLNVINLINIKYLTIFIIIFYAILVTFICLLIDKVKQMLFKVFRIDRFLKSISVFVERMFLKFITGDQEI